MPELAANFKAGLKLDGDQLAGILGRYNEVTQRLKDSHDELQGQVRRLHGELANKNMQLERRKRLAALGEMAAGLAHEIRNPLGGIQLYASLLRRDLEDRPKLQELAEKITSGVQILDRLVNDVLSLAQTVQVQISPVDVGQIICSAVDLVSAQLAQRTVQLSTDVPAGMPQLCADRNMLSRAVLNLLLNALDACGTSGKVQIRVRPESSTVRIEVSDTGAGVSEELMDKIFNPFFTTKDCGTGLGLAMVHRIAEAHQGSVSVYNVPGGGACFVVSLPYKPSWAAGQSDEE